MKSSKAAFGIAINNPIEIIENLNSFNFFGLHIVETKVQANTRTYVTLCITYSHKRHVTVAIPYIVYTWQWTATPDT